jgi:hypothetical protein
MKIGAALLPEMLANYIKLYDITVQRELLVILGL